MEQEFNFKSNFKYPDTCQAESACFHYTDSTWSVQKKKKWPLNKEREMLL